jgi:L-fuculose-phosphate aldolase
MAEPQLREAIVEVGRLLAEKGWVAATEGNISVRLPGDRVLVTPSGVAKGRLTPEALIITDMNGVRLEGEGVPSSEIGIHLAAYRARPEIGAVVHSHPPFATGFAAAGRALNQGVLPEVIVGLGSIPLAPYGQPGTDALVDAVAPLLETYDAILLANHGVLTCGPDVMTAWFRTETVEQFARITLVAELLGGPRLLPRQEIQKLFDARPRYGVQSPNRFEPGSPLAEEDV